MHYSAYHSNMLDMTAHNLSRDAACTHVWTSTFDEAVTQAKLLLECHRNPDIQHVLGSEGRMLFINVWISYGIDTLHACLFVIVSTLTHSCLLTTTTANPVTACCLGIVQRDTIGVCFKVIVACTQQKRTRQPETQPVLGSAYSKILIALGRNCASLAALCLRMLQCYRLA